MLNLNHIELATIQMIDQIHLSGSQIMSNEEYSYRGTNFIIECKEHINRVASPGSRNYIIRGLLSYGEKVEVPKSIDGDPVTSFMPSFTPAQKIVYPGIKRLCLPGHLGRFPERNDIFPDLEKLEVDPENQIFCTDGKMLYRDEGKELCLSLCAGNRDETVTVPHKVMRIGPNAFAGSKCEKIIFENPRIEAEDTSFDRSVWLGSCGPSVYVGNMLYRISTNNTDRRLTIVIKEGTQRIHKSVFTGIGTETNLKLCIPEKMKFPGFTDAIVEALRNASVRDVHKSPGLITVSRMAGAQHVGKEISIPLSLDSNGRDLLRRTLDFGEDLYDEIFDCIGSGKEKLDYALFAASKDYNVAQDSYRKYIEDNQDKAAFRAAQILSEESIFCLIKRNLLGREALLGILPKLQEYGMVNAAAGILIAVSRGHI